jgi:hypothetical protein
MKTKILSFLILISSILLPSCATKVEVGSYHIVTTDPAGDYRAKEVQVIDETNTIKFKDLNGVSHTFQGSYELFEE